ncbi:MAG TPA: DUF2076 domain-containing protein [Xanthobacteraceae bacterium]|nr:DUF2076 domain-containing protein [Xanthobacteraceae bacterium]
MTPAERQLVTDLFDRLATLEDAQRDPDAERVIRDGLAQAPNAVYALVQTALVQDEALRQANARIEELEGQLGFGNAQRQGGGGFLDNMRDSIFGRRQESPERGSVPSIRSGGGGAPMGAPPAFGGPGQPMGGPGYGAPGQMQPPPEPQGGRGGSFLGTAAAAAVGVIGGSMLMNGLRGMTGGSGSGHGIADQAHAAGGSPWGNSGGGGLPWGNSGGSGGDLARQAGVNDIGRSSGADPFGQSQSGQSQGAFNDSRGGKSGETDIHDEAEPEDDSFDDDDADYDDGGDGGEE